MESSVGFPLLLMPLISILICFCSVTFAHMGWGDGVWRKKLVQYTYNLGLRILTYFRVPKSQDHGIQDPGHILGRIQTFQFHMSFSELISAKLIVSYGVWGAKTKYYMFYTSNKVQMHNNGCFTWKTCVKRILNSLKNFGHFLLAKSGSRTFFAFQKLCFMVISKPIRV